MTPTFASRYGTMRPSKNANSGSVGIAIAFSPFRPQSTFESTLTFVRVRFPLHPNWHEYKIHFSPRVDWPREPGGRVRRAAPGRLVRRTGDDLGAARGRSPRSLRAGGDRNGLAAAVGAGARRRARREPDDDRRRRL